MGRQTRVIHIFAKKYANQLKENLEIMNTNHSEIRKLLKNYDSTKSNSDEIIDTLNQIKNLKQERQEKKQKVEESNQNVVALEKKIISLQTSIEEIKSSDNYKKYIYLKNQISSFSTQKSKIKNEIDSQFTKISRPLSRYEYGSSLDKDQKKLLSKLVDNPIDVLLPQNKDSIIIILENVRKGISSGSISVKDVDKSLSYITETEEILDAFVKQVSEYLAKHEKMTYDLNSLSSKELESLENDLAKHLSLKEDLRQKSEMIKNEMDEIDSRIPELVSDIEGKLREFSNTKYTVLPS